MLNKIDHVGVAVNSLERVKHLFNMLFGIKPDFEETVEEQNVRVAGFRVGESNIEFLEPMNENSPISKFLDKRGEGLHHLALNVDNIEELLSEIKSKNLKLIDEKPRLGAEGKKIAFAHPKSFHGILLEFSEEKKI